MKSPQRYIFIFLGLVFCIVVLQCARFRVKELEANLLFSLPVLPASVKSNPKGQLQALQTEGMVYNFPMRPAVSSSRVYLADASHRLIRVFSRGEEVPELVLGLERPLGMKSKIAFKQVDMGIPGWVAVDKNDKNIYIQSYLPIKVERTSRLPEKRFPGRQSVMQRAPSFILQLSGRGKLKAKIGIEGQNSQPFSLILSLRPDGKEKLNVLHKRKNKMELLVFKKSVLVRRFVQPELELELARNTFVTLEAIYPAANRDFVIGSVAVRRKSNFDLIERVVYYQESPESKARVLLYNDNPMDFLTWASAKGGFYILHAEEDGSGLLFKIFSNRGEYLSNRRVFFSGLRSFWRDVFIDLHGQIFGAQVKNSRFLLYEWE